MASAVELMKAIAVLFEDDNMTVVEAEDPSMRGLILLTFEKIEKHESRIAAIVKMVRQCGMFSDWPIHIFHPSGLLVFAANGDKWDE